ncbi:hypothetical protein GIB67_031868 [Kingdonia uniflora]|uniref:B box-type domain-containing protein n=1 Tax=Kingdonia uniflora TaxID=39325 RepID=A0A7J7L4T6_9MAGN|nr:hypothetical protein GIB67_031868 [Kingdonia uniflora]
MTSPPQGPGLPMLEPSVFNLNPITGFSPLTSYYMNRFGYDWNRSKLKNSDGEIFWENSLLGGLELLREISEPLGNLINNVAAFISMYSYLQVHLDFQNFPKNDSRRYMLAIRVMFKMVMKPAWLEGLIAETFFSACGTHESRRKNDKNIFCLDCCRSICTHCVSSHCSHTLLQVRRYVYNDVVRLDELEKLIDCSYVQSYTINSAKVVFLNQRPQPQSRACKESSNLCFTCDRILQDPFHFCSLSCKVDHMIFQGDDLSSIVYRFAEPEFAFSQFETLQMDLPEDEDEQVGPNNSRSNSSVSHELGVVKKKRGSGFLPGIVLSLSRRKGAPQRSPLS